MVTLKVFIIFFLSLYNLYPYCQFVQLDAGGTTTEIGQTSPTPGTRHSALQPKPNMIQPKLYLLLMVSAIAAEVLSPSFPLHPPPSPSVPSAPVEGSLPQEWCCPPFPPPTWLS